MTVLITLTTAGISTGPFNLYSNVDGYAVPFESSVPKASLVLGYTSVLVPTGTTTVQVKSLGTCTTGVNILIGGVTTTTAIPTTTIAPTTSTTTTVVPTTTSTSTSTTTTVSPLPPGAELFVVTQGYTTAQLACNNYTNNSGNTGGVGTAGQIYVAGNMAYNANGTPFVGNPALFYIITPYINITPGLESTCHISALGVVTSGGTLDCLTINIP
jgi:hypothetical protein